MESVGKYKAKTENKFDSDMLVNAKHYMDDQVIWPYIGERERQRKSNVNSGHYVLSATSKDSAPTSL
jgi:hypothetical protein